jgi:hypothetical protein
MSCRPAAACVTTRTYEASHRPLYEWALSPGRTIRHKHLDRSLKAEPSPLLSCGVAANDEATPTSLQADGRVAQCSHDLHPHRHSRGPRT